MLSWHLRVIVIILLCGKAWKRSYTVSMSALYLRHSVQLKANVINESD